MAINFPCSSCGKMLTAKDEHAGKRMKCQTCQAINNIPCILNDLGRHGTAHVQPALSESTTTAASQVSQALRSNVLKRGALVILIVMFGVSCFVLGSLNRPGQPNQQPQATAQAEKQPPADSVKRQSDEAADRARLLALAGPQDPFQPLPVGSECVLFINGDENKRQPGLAESGVVANDSLVLVIPYQAVLPRNCLVFGEGAFAGIPIRSPNMIVWKAYVDAIQAFDPDGIDGLIDQGHALRLQVGTRVRVIDLRSGASLLPCDGRGARTVRITEGQSKRKAVLIPARNLRAIPDNPSKSPADATSSTTPAPREPVRSLL